MQLLELELLLLRWILAIKFVVTEKWGSACASPRNAKQPRWRDVLKKIIARQNVFSLKSTGWTSSSRWDMGKTRKEKEKRGSSTRGSRGVSGKSNASFNCSRRIPQLAGADRQTDRLTLRWTDREMKLICATSWSKKEGEQQKEREKNKKIPFFCEGWQKNPGVRLSLYLSCDLLVHILRVTCHL